MSMYSENTEELLSSLLASFFIRLLMDAPKAVEFFAFSWASVKIPNLLDKFARVILKLFLSKYMHG